ncbi:sialate O-acetylesterase [Flavihumibacter sp. UBA7668]|uniref:sialate O-acetylesterase n=1 Tax=Flavihumibacter sp. UBA7668 TaxID=1946542 RepID=UPI0025C068AB|nr:sialate O-acetylesterase [Flavihumibacter sp. UBA7668]
MKQANQKIWCVSSVLTLILTLLVSLTHAQPVLPSIPNGTLTSFPLDFQLYPRVITPDANPDVAVVTIAGTINNTVPYTSLQVRVYRDNTAPGPGYTYSQISTINSALTYNGFGIANFSITHNLIAELNDHKYELYGFLGGNFTLLADAEQVVAGDAFIIQGQSNALAEYLPIRDMPADEPNNHFVRVYGSSDNRGYAESPSDWNVGNRLASYQADYNTGMWGMRFAKELATANNVPVAILNGGYGSDIPYFRKNFSAQQDGAGDGSNNYSRLLRRANESGLRTSIRGILWWQGESDIINVQLNPLLESTAKNTYINEFTGLHSEWESDYPALVKTFMFQVRMGCNIYPGQSSINATIPIIQAQLEIANANSDIEIISTQNLNHVYEGTWYCHYRYGNTGYQYIANRMTTLVRQELYGLPEQTNTRSFYPTGIDFTGTNLNGAPNQITIELSNLADTYSILTDPLGTQITSVFRVEGPSSYTITSVTINGFSVVFNFNNPSNTIPTGLSYHGRDAYNAPSIVNSGGLGLLGFSLPITPGSLPIDPLSLTVSRSGVANTLRWKVESNERFDQFIVERGETRNSFKQIYDMYGTGQDGNIQYDFTDNKPNTTVSHYRIRAIQQDGRELYSQVVTVNNRLNSVKEFRVYPNPVAGSANATINMNEAALATINLHDASGRLLSSRKLQLQKGNNQFSMGELLDYNPGTYIVRVVTPTETQQIRVVKAK